MSKDVRIINGYIEANYERIAQLMPNQDERDVRELLTPEYVDDFDGYDDGFATGREEGAQDAADKVEEVLKKLVANARLSKELMDEIMEAIDV